MLYIDASRYNNTDQKTGVENYSYYLINELIKQAPGQATLISPRKIDLKTPQIIIPMKRLWTQVRLSWEIWHNRKIDNLFIPSHVMPLIHPRRTIITIHDVAWRRFPESYSKKSRKYLEWSTKYAVRHAQKIIVPSEATKQDLIKFYACEEDRIVVIPLGIAPKRTDRINPVSTKNILARYKLQPKNYFLFIGRIETKKNIATLLKAFDHLTNSPEKGSIQRSASGGVPAPKLVLAGKTGVGGNELLIKIHNRNVVVTGYIDELTKEVLLENSAAFIFPSLYEGFGLPLLEAMQAKTPIIASKIPSSMEIAKENALFFKPQDANTLIKHMKTVIQNPDLRGELTKNHHKTVKRYTWERCTENTLKILKIVV